MANLFGRSETLAAAHRRAMPWATVWVTVWVTVWATVWAMVSLLAGNTSAPKVLPLLGS